MEKKILLRYSLFFICYFALSSMQANASTEPGRASLYEIRIYHFKDSMQERILDEYLQQAFLPALHRAGFAKIGVFKVIGNDTLDDKKVFVLISFKSFEQFQKLPAVLAKDETFKTTGSSYINAAYKTPAFNRIESILLNAFPMAPGLTFPALRSPLNERVYELRSYESASEKDHLNKVDMFNKGGEVELFKQLGFNAIFYGAVVSGNRMPNLMYMTSFENKTDRDMHWKTFGSDPRWKKLSAMPEYQNNVSHIDIVFLRPTVYSDF